MSPVRLWTLERADNLAICEAVPHVMGVELVVSIGTGSAQQQAFRLPASTITKADELRRSFLDFGWVDVQDKQTAH